MKFYLAKHPILIWYLSVVDSLCKIFLSFSKKKHTNAKMNSILIANIAHLGDVILSTSILLIIKNKYPQIKIGFLTSSSSSEILKNHPLIDKLHVLDHPKLSRLQISYLKKFLRFIRTFFTARKTIQAENYDCFMELYPYYPNSIFLAHACKIPKKVGFTSGGYGPLLTDSYTFLPHQYHLTKYFESLLKSFSIENSSGSYLCPFLPIGEHQWNTIKMKCSIQNPYVVFHLYSGNQKKNWDINEWSVLIDEFSKKGFHIVLTGSLSDEEQFKREVHRKTFKTISLMGKLSFEDIKMCVKESKLLVAVDTFIVHLGLGFSVKTLVIKPHPTDCLYWDPPTQHAIALKPEQKETQGKMSLQTIDACQVLKVAYNLLQTT